ncbi:hypothetical protein BRC94_07055 [Halobacteriales archaeon QS_5_70_17]|nr:MAG: hypothetical protein BRC94_07055 [Halobacteriales archaeon QS_5_70_17]
MRVNAAAPGSTRAPLIEENGSLEGGTGEEFLDRTAPERRSGEPEDVARVVVFLASDYAQWVPRGDDPRRRRPVHPRAHSYWDVLDEMGVFEQ